MTVDVECTLVSLNEGSSFSAGFSESATKGHMLFKSILNSKILLLF